MKNNTTRKYTPNHTGIFSPLHRAAACLLAVALAAASVPVIQAEGEESAAPAPQIPQLYRQMMRAGTVIFIYAHSVSSRCSSAVRRC